MTTSHFMTSWIKAGLAKVGSLVGSLFHRHESAQARISRSEAALIGQEIRRQIAENIRRSEELEREQVTKRFQCFFASVRDQIDLGQDDELGASGVIEPLSGKPEDLQIGADSGINEDDDEYIMDEDEMQAMDAAIRQVEELLSASSDGEGFAGNLDLDEEAVLDEEPPVAEPAPNRVKELAAKIKAPIGAPAPPGLFKKTDSPKEDDGPTQVNPAPPIVRRRIMMNARRTPVPLSDT